MIKCMKSSNMNINMSNSLSVTNRKGSVLWHGVMSQEDVVWPFWKNAQDDKRNIHFQKVWKNPTRENAPKGNPGSATEQEEQYMIHS